MGWGNGINSIIKLIGIIFLLCSMSSCFKSIRKTSLQNNNSFVELKSSFGPASISTNNQGLSLESSISSTDKGH
jgi:hypothetical protein